MCICRTESCKGLLWASKRFGTCNQVVLSQKNKPPLRLWGEALSYWCWVCKYSKLEASHTVSPGLLVGSKPSLKCMQINLVFHSSLRQNMATMLWSISEIQPRPIAWAGSRLRAGSCLYTSKTALYWISKQCSLSGLWVSTDQEMFCRLVALSCLCWISSLSSRSAATILSFSAQQSKSSEEMTRISMLSTVL